MPGSKPKRIRRDPETTRSLILDQTEAIMIEQGYAAVSSRRVAQALKINAATVHYYFPTTDDLFIALHQRLIERQILELKSVLDAEKPLLAFWEYQSTWSQAALGVEFLALCNHRKSLGDVLSQSADKARDDQVKALRQAIFGSAQIPEGVDTVALATILTAVGRLLVNEERVGITGGHTEVRALVESALDRLLAEPTGKDRWADLLTPLP